MNLVALTVKILQPCRDKFGSISLEYPGKDPRDGWVHCSYNRLDNRMQVLTAVKEKGKTVYKKGLPSNG